MVQFNTVYLPRHVTAPIVSLPTRQMKSICWAAHKMHRQLLLLLLGLSLAISGLAQVTSDRLLPESVARQVTIDWKQDGRVAQLDITNPKTFPVLTLLVIDLQYEALPPRPLPPAPAQRQSLKGKARTGQTPELDLEALERFMAELEAKASEQLTVVIQPGTNIKPQIELKPNRRLLGLTLREARGRDQTTFERLKSMAF